QGGRYSSRQVAAFDHHALELGLPNRCAVRRSDLGNKLERAELRHTRPSNRVMSNSWRHAAAEALWLRSESGLSELPQCQTGRNRRSQRVSFAWIFHARYGNCEVSNDALEREPQASTPLRGIQRHQHTTHGWNIGHT